MKITFDHSKISQKLRIIIKMKKERFVEIKNPKFIIIEN